MEGSNSQTPLRVQNEAGSHAIEVVAQNKPEPLSITSPPAVGRQECCCCCCCCTCCLRGWCPFWFFMTLGALCVGIFMVIMTGFVNKSFFKPAKSHVEGSGGMLIAIAVCLIAALYALIARNNKGRVVLPMMAAVRRIWRSRGRRFSFSSHTGNGSLLDGFRGGEMEYQLLMAEDKDLIDMLPVVCTAISLIPFGMTMLRKTLCQIFEAKVSANAFMEQTFLFYLNSCRDSAEVKRIWSHHPMMDLSKSSSSNHDLEDGDRKMDSEPSVSFPTSYTNDKKNLTRNYDREIESKQSSGGQNSNTVMTFTRNNAIDFFASPLVHNGEKGFTVVISDPHGSSPCFYDPMSGDPYVSQIEVEKMFSSNAKPLLINCFTRPRPNGDMKLSSQFILKQGDDLRKDTAVMAMFQYVNALWEENGLSFNAHLVEALVYKVVPMGAEFGVIELVDDCLPLRKCHEMELDDYQLSKMVATGAGSYIAAFILGIRDRHDDNILVRQADACMFHIDFGYMLGERVTGLDTNKFAITKSFKDLLGSRWDQFVHLSSQSWLILRENIEELVDYARVVFALLYTPSEVEAFIRKHLRADDSVEDARDYIEQKLIKAPHMMKTKMKNVVHSFARKMKG